MRKTNHYGTMRRLYELEGEMYYHLAVFGEHLAKNKKYTGLDGMEAIYLYLVNKHHWTPAQVRGMSKEDLRFVLTEEMADWVLPKEARGKQ